MLKLKTIVSAEFEFASKVLNTILGTLSVDCKFTTCVWLKLSVKLKNSTKENSFDIIFFGFKEFSYNNTKYFAQKICKKIKM